MADVCEITLDISTLKFIIYPLINIKELKMVALTIIWLISNLWGFYLAKQNHVQLTLFRKLVGLSLGPFAIPLIYMVKQKPS